MFIKQIVFALLPALSGAVSVDKRIVGGQPASKGQFPYIVVLTGLDDQGLIYNFCGGSLLNANTVLTAAHCLDFFAGTPTNFSVRAGSLDYDKGGVTSLVKSFVQDPKYNSSTTNNDFGILKLATPIKESCDIKYAKLQTSLVDPKAGTPAIVAGWGLDSDGGYRRENLYWVEEPIVSREACAKDFGDGEITTSMICAGVPQGGKGDCTGDSGGPLSINGVVNGVVSFSQGCAQAGYPGVYAKVATGLDFIQKHL